MAIARSHNGGSVHLRLVVTRWTLCILVVALGAGSSYATPIKPTTEPKLSPDCSTLIVTNNRRLSSSQKNNPAGSTVGGCNGGRQAKKLPAAVSRLFREEVDNYPEEEIRRILKQTPGSVKDLYNVQNTRLDPGANLTARTFYPNDDADIDTEREENVCRTVTRNVYPREANLHNSLVYIPNNQDFMQVIQAEICQHSDEECNYLRDSLPYGMTSSCVQRYSYKKLLYMDPLDKRMASDLFRYPSCCVCMVKVLPLDNRSTRGNQSLPVNKHVSLSSTTTTTTIPSDLSSSDIIDRKGFGAAHDNNANDGLGPQRQPIDRSHDSESPAPRPTRRSSKQLRRPNNQTLILSDDKVYAPTR